MDTLGQVVSSSGTKAFLRPPSLSLRLLSLPHLVLVGTSLHTPPLQMEKLDLGLFIVQKAGDTAWHSCWERGRDREGLAHSLSFSLKLRDSVTCLRPHVDRKEAYHGAQQPGNCQWGRYSRNPPLKPPLPKTG